MGFGVANTEEEQTPLQFFVLEMRSWGYHEAVLFSDLGWFHEAVRKRTACAHGCALFMTCEAVMWVVEALGKGSFFRVKGPPVPE